MLLRPYSLCPGITKRARQGLSPDNMGPYKPNQMSSFILWPFRDIKHVCICLSLSVTLKAQISAFLLRKTPRRNLIKRWHTVKETANPSLEKMTTVARVIGPKDMPIGKMLVGLLLQPRDQRDTRRKFKIVPICLILSINPTKWSRIYGNHSNQTSSARPSV